MRFYTIHGRFIFFLSFFILLLSSNYSHAEYGSQTVCIDSLGQAPPVISAVWGCTWAPCESYDLRNVTNLPCGATCKGYLYGHCNEGSGGSFSYHFTNFWHCENGFPWGYGSTVAGQDTFTQTLYIPEEASTPVTVGVTTDGVSIMTVNGNPHCGSGVYDLGVTSAYQYGENKITLVSPRWTIGGGIGSSWHICVNYVGPPPTPTATFTPTSTETPTDTETWTPTVTDTPTFTVTPTSSNTDTFTDTDTFTSTDSPTFTWTLTLTDTPTDTPTGTQSPTATPTPSGTITPTPTEKGTPDKDCSGSDATNYKNGNVVFSDTDVSINNGTIMNVSRTYNSADPPTIGLFGRCWTSNLDEYLTSNGADIQLWRGDGALRGFSAITGGGYSHSPGYDYSLFAVGTGWERQSAQGDVRQYDQNGRVVQDTDRDGNVVTYNYAGGKLVSLTDDKGRSVSFAYTSDGLHIATVTDPLQRVWNYTYNNDDLISVNAPGNRQASYTYDPMTHRMIESQDPMFRKGMRHLKFNYDSLGRAWQTTDENNVTLLQIAWQADTLGGVLAQVSEYGGSCASCLSGGGTYHYDANGVLVSVQKPLGVNRTYVKDSDLNPVTVVNARGYSTNSIYDDYGNPLTVVNAKNETTSYAYDPSYHLVTSIRDPRNPAIRFTYDSKGNLLTRSSDSGLDGNGTTYTYNSAGQVLTKTDGNFHTWQYSYDNFGNLQSQTDPEGNTVSFTYDVMGRLTTRTDAKGNQPVSYTWDDADRLVSVQGPGDYYAEYGYDTNGNKVYELDSKRQKTTFQYDDKDRLVQVVNAKNQAVSYAYDNAGNLVYLVDPRGKWTTFGYDDLNRLTSVKDMVHPATSYSYNLNGSVTLKTDGNGKSTSYDYDELDRLQAVHCPDGRNITFTYDSAGNLINRSDVMGTYSFVYDSLNRMTSKTDPFGYALRFNYDPAGNLNKLTYPDGRWVTYGYSTANQVVLARTQSGREVDFHHDANFVLDRVTYPNGIVTNLNSDMRNAVTQITSTGSSGYGVPNYSYVRDANGNPTTITRDGKVSVFDYDPINQLTGANVVYGMTANPWNYVQNITYDDSGNRQTVNENGNKTIYTVDDANQLLSVGASSGGSANLPEVIKTSVLAKAFDYRSIFHSAEKEVVAVPLPTPTPSTNAHSILRFLGAMFPNPGEAQASDLMVDLQVNCSTQDTQGKRYNFKIINNGAAPLTLVGLDLAVRMWFNEPQLRCGVISNNVGAVYSSDGTRMGVINFTRYGYNQAVSITPITDVNGKTSNQVLTEPVSYDSGVLIIPPGGWAQGLQIMSTSGGSCAGGADNWDNFGDDYTTLTNCGDSTDGPYYDASCFVLLSNGVVVQEVKAGGVVDPNRGRPPSPSTSTPTPTRTWSRTNTPTWTPTNSSSFTKTPTLSMTPTFSKTFTRTFTWTPTKSKTPTNTPTRTWTPTVTLTPTPTSSSTRTNTGTWTPTDTSSSTWTWTVTNTPIDTDTPTGTWTPTVTLTPTPTPSSTRTNTGTWTPTDTPSSTWTWTVTNTPIDTDTPTGTWTPTVTLTPTPTPSSTRTNTGTWTPTDTPSSTWTWTVTNTPIDTDTPTGTWTPTVTLTPTPTSSSTRTNTGTWTPTDTPSSTWTWTVTNTPINTDTPTGTWTPTVTLTQTPTPSSTRTNTGTWTPTDTPSSTWTWTVTNTPIDTDTPTGTWTSTVTLTPTPTPSPTWTWTLSLTSTFTNTRSYTPTQTPTWTPSATWSITSTFTETPTITNTANPTSTLCIEFERQWADSTFANPVGVGIDSVGTVYLAGHNTNTIFVFNPQGVWQRQWMGPAYPNDLVVGKNDAVYVASDSPQRNIVKYDSVGNASVTFSVGVGSLRLATDTAGNIYTTDGGSGVWVYAADGSPVTSWGVSGPSEGQLSGTCGIAVGPDGYVYVGETGNHRVSVFDVNGVFQRCIYGVGATIVDNPIYLKFDIQGRLWVSDDNMLKVYDVNGGVLGRFGVTGNDPGQFNGLAFTMDTAGRIFEGDGNTNRLQLFVLCGMEPTATQTVTPVVSPCIEYSTQFVSTDFGNPVGLGTDTSGNVYLTGHNKWVVYVFNAMGAWQRQWVSPEYPNDLVVSADNTVYVASDWPSRKIVKSDMFGNGPVTFSVNTGSVRLATGANGNVYTTDGGYRVWIYTKEGAAVTSWGTSGNLQGQLSGAYGIAVGPDGYVYVGETGNHRVSVFDVNGVYQRSFTGAGVTIDSPSYLKFDAQGRLWVSDDNILKVYDTYGNFLYQYGSAGNNAGQFNGLSFTVNSNVQVYEGDFNTNRIQKFVPCGTVPADTPTASPTRATGVCEEVDGAGTIKDSSMNWVSGVGLGKDGNIFIANWTGAFVQVLDKNLTYVRQFGSGGGSVTQLSGPAQVVMDNNNGLAYVLDNDNGRVSAWKQDGTPVTVYGAGLLNGPHGMALDGLGYLYVADSNHHQVMKFDLSSGTAVVTMGGVQGGLEGMMNYPEGIAFGPDGNLWVAEGNNRRFSVFQTDGTFVQAVTATGGTWNNPIQIRIQDGMIWELDHDTNKLQTFDLQGRFLKAYVGGGSGAGQVNDTRGFELDANDGLYMADGSGNRVVRYDVCGMAPTPTYTPTPIATICEQANASQVIKDSSMNWVSGVGLGKDGNIFIANWTGAFVQVLDKNLAYVRRFGSGGGGVTQLSGPAQDRDGQQQRLGIRAG
jgi:YD repeat-containing protein